MSKAKARFDFKTDATAKVLEIIDRDGSRSVTNDADAVIEDIAALGIAVDDYTIVYRDSRGIWDGMTTRDGRFHGFILLATVDPARAALAMRLRRG